MARYSKTYSSPAQLVSLLQSRGLLIENATRTENYLRHIGYYRFSAYLYPLLATPKENHVFKSGTTFNQALDMYRFDRHLRLLMFNEIEKIEVAVRSAIVNITSRETGNPFWMTNPSCFYTGKDMANGGGTLFLEGDKKEWEAAGHCAAYTFDGEDIFICHGYSATQNGAALLIQRPISWTVDGWPELHP